MFEWTRGVSGRVTGPIKYTMNYFNGPFTYRESFAEITCSAGYVNAMGGGVQAVIAGLNAIPYVGPALSAIASFGAHWYGNASRNPDGSITFFFAYHYAGTKAGGIDLTAWPIPGVDASHWQGVVNGLITAIRTLNARGPYRQNAQTPFADAAPGAEVIEEEAPEESFTLSGDVEGERPES